jgi:CRP-like cAMP-binding protein
MFSKEKVQRGHKILTQGKENDFIYMVFKGKVRILLDASTLDNKILC